MSAYYYSNQGGGGGAPGYKDGGRYYGDHDVQMAMPARSVSERPGWSWCATVWASIAFFCCPWCLVCTFPSLLCLSHSYADHKVGDYDRAAHKRSCGIGWMVTAWVLGILLIVAIGVLSYLASVGTIDPTIYNQVLSFLGY